MDLQAMKTLSWILMPCLSWTSVSAGDVWLNLAEPLYLQRLLVPGADCSHEIKKMIASWQESYEKRTVLGVETSLCRQSSV